MEVWTSSNKDMNGGEMGMTDPRNDNQTLNALFHGSPGMSMRDISERIPTKGSVREKKTAQHLQIVGHVEKRARIG